MNKKILLIEWIAVLIFLIIPPLLVNPGSTATIANNGKISPFLLLRLIIAIFLYYQQIYVSKKTTCDKKGRFRLVMLFLSWSALCFGFLMIIQALMQALTLILPVDYKETLIDLNFSKFEYAVVFLNLLAGAFYEEVIYREYLPETLLLFSKERKIPAILSECACVLVFAMSHRYLGLMAVLNALLGGIMLQSVVPGPDPSSLWKSMTQGCLEKFVIIKM